MFVYQQFYSQRGKVNQTAKSVNGSENATLSIYKDIILAGWAKIRKNILFIRNYTQVLCRIITNRLSIIENNGKRESAKIRY